MRVGYGADNNDLQSDLYFENIDLGKVSFSGNDLKNKDFQIVIKEFMRGKLLRADVVFDSKEDEYFKIKDDKFDFRVLTKVTSKNTVKFDFQFNGFSKDKEYKTAAAHKEFALKSFLGNKPEISILLNTNSYILTYMTPYIKKDGSKAYCKIVQADVRPEELRIRFII